MAELGVQIETFPLRHHFTISRGRKTETVVVLATLRDGEIVGRGECCPNTRYDETPEDVAADIRAMAPALRDGLTRDALQDVMPPGAARNALDCALWDFEAHAFGVPAWALAGLNEPFLVETAFTLSADDPAEMAAAAAAKTSKAAAHRYPHVTSTITAKELAG